jgi:hypothetical protein
VVAYARLTYSLLHAALMKAQELGKGFENELRSIDFNLDGGLEQFE